MKTIINYHLKIQSDDVIETEKLGSEEPRRAKLNRTYLQLAKAYSKANEHGVLDYLGEKEARNAFQQLGKYLFSLLFQGEIRGHFEERILRQYVLANNPDVYIRFRLIFQPEVSLEIISLPWEFIYHHKKDIFLASHPKIIFSYQYNNLLSSEIEGYDQYSNKNLKILFLHSHPEDLKGIGYVTVRQKIKYLTEKDNVDYQEYSNLSIRELKEKITEYKPHVFHFLTHGKSNNVSGDFAFVNEEKKAFWYDNQSFSYLFESWQPKLIILQSCESGKISSFQFSGGASWLIRKRIPAVIAWRYPLRQQEGWIFLEEFYQSLAEGNPIDKAVQQGRNNLAISNDKPAYSTRSFGTPILWNNLKDSKLFIINNPEAKWEKIINEIEEKIYLTQEGKRKINALVVAKLIGDNKDNNYQTIAKLIDIGNKDLEKNPCADIFQAKLSIIYHNFKKALELYKNEEQPLTMVKIDFLNQPLKILFSNNSLPKNIDSIKSVVEYLNELDLFEKFITIQRNNIFNRY